MNLTNLTSVQGYVVPGQTLKFSELVADLCSQLEYKVLLCVALVYTFYVFSNYTVPLFFALFRGRRYAFSRKVAKFVVGVLDALALMSIIFVFYLFWLQGQMTGPVFNWIILVTALVPIGAGLFLMDRHIRRKGLRYHSLRNR